MSDRQHRHHEQSISYGVDSVQQVRRSLGGFKVSLFDWEEEVSSEADMAGGTAFDRGDMGPSSVRD